MKKHALTLVALTLAGLALGSGGLAAADPGRIARAAPDDDPGGDGRQGQRVLDLPLRRHR